MPANLENSAVATGLEQVCFHSNPKECSNYCTTVLNSHTSKVMLKILQARLKQHVNQERHRPQHATLPCLSLSLRVCSNSRPLSLQCHPTISYSVALLLSTVFPQHQSLFQWVRACRMNWPKYWSFGFSISPSSEYSGLISFRIDWFDLHAVQESFFRTTILKH